MLARRLNSTCIRYGIIASRAIICVRAGTFTTIQSRSAHTAIIALCSRSRAVVVCQGAVLAEKSTSAGASIVIHRSEGFTCRTLAGPAILAWIRCTFVRASVSVLAILTVVATLAGAVI